ncbi:hypothetical protein PLICRDRAFT_92854 [Plicaturopsis crispa FD-325 SS-3]|nr:hypothetical protein PLICRDRAFT_92854 [Plicaturopsis crispa FD-325 SS-3]
MSQKHVDSAGSGCMLDMLLRCLRPSQCPCTFGRIALNHLNSAACSSSRPSLLESVFRLAKGFLPPPHNRRNLFPDSTRPPRWWRLRRIAFQHSISPALSCRMGTGSLGFRRSFPPLSGRPRTPHAASRWSSVRPSSLVEIDPSTTYVCPYYRWISYTRRAEIKRAVLISIVPWRCIASMCYSA